MNHRSIYSILALAVLIGTISDKTTGQPLQGITVTVTTGSSTLHSKTDAAGHFVFKSISDGTYTLHFSSKDVPAQSAHVRVSGASTHITLKACSTTLDYSCGGSDGGSSGA